VTQPLLFSLFLGLIKRLNTERQIFKINQMHCYQILNGLALSVRYGLIISDTQNNDITLLITK